MLQWLPAIVIFVYLAVVLYIGVFAFRRGKTTGQDFFLASRSIGSIFFFLSLFATNMTAFAILGSSGMAYKVGIGVFGMMATSSALVIPLTLFFIGTRLWAFGKRFGHVTQVSFFRDRYECSFIGTIIFLVTAAMLVPYLIISIDGGGTILNSLTNGKISYPIGGAIVALIVMATVFFGGMRGAVWVNVLQTLLFITFGIIAFTWIDKHMPGGFSGTVDAMVKSKANAIKDAPAMAKPITLLTRERIPWQVFLSFMLIPLSSIMFPHMSMMCFTAKKVTAFKKTVILYPLCIMAIWLPCVFLGALGPNVPAFADLPGGPKHYTVKQEVSANSELLKTWLETGGKTAEPSKQPEGLLIGLNKAFPEAIADPKTPPPMIPLIKALLADVQAKKFVVDDKVEPMLAVQRFDAIKSPIIQAAWGKVASNNSDSVLLEMLKTYVPDGDFLAKCLAGLLAAGIISAVMGSDCHQILGLSTMFTKDIFNFYAGKKGLSDRTVVNMGRAFIVIINGIAYIIALGRPPIFDLAVTYAFSGFAALAPMMIAALFWKRSTKWGLLACTVWVGACVGFMVYAEGFHHFKANDALLHIGSFRILYMTEMAKLSLLGFSMVVPMTIGSCLLVWLVSLISSPPSQATIDRYFSKTGSKEGGFAAAAAR